MVVPELSRRGISARAMVRNEEQAKLAVANGAAEVVIADLRDPRSLDKASSGVSGVFHIGPAFAADEARMGLNMASWAVARFCSVPPMLGGNNACSGNRW